ncbi:MAG TPA: ATP-dependent helicase, partial [Chitinophagaceae bacterium]|nr:ATP-dependent helicase [Chitinophagaceae bacterium]
VLNYDVPEIAENYVHRIGRTGRGFEKGQAWTFCSEEEKPLLDAIEEYIHKKIAVLDVSREDFRMTKALSEGPERDWKKLLEENEKNLQQQKRKKKS